RGVPARAGGQGPRSGGGGDLQPRQCLPRPAEAPAGGRRRSEEHTSELQSLTNLVCRLLLEKKKQRQSHQVYKRNNNYPILRQPAKPAQLADADSRLCTARQEARRIVSRVLRPCTLASLSPQ